MGIVLYENVGEGGWAYPIAENQDVPCMAPPYWRAASSVIIDVDAWVTLWESCNYDQGDDSFWIQSPGQGKYWKLDNLHQIWRPHGNNQWGDRIAAVSYSGAPPVSNIDNQTILFADGTWGGNIGLLGSLLRDRYHESVSGLISLENKPAPDAKRTWPAALKAR